MRSNDGHPLRSQAALGRANETAAVVVANRDQPSRWRERAQKLAKGVGFGLSVAGALIVGLYRGGEVPRKVRSTVCPLVHIRVICGAKVARAELLPPVSAPDLSGLARLRNGDVVELVQLSKCGHCEAGVPIHTDARNDSPIRATLFRGQSGKMPVLLTSADSRWVLVLYRRDSQGWIGREDLALVPRTTPASRPKTPATPILRIPSAPPMGSERRQTERSEGDGAGSECVEVLLWRESKTLPLRLRADPLSPRVGNAVRTRRFRVSRRAAIAKSGTRFFALPCNVPGSQCADRNRRFGWASERQLRELPDEMCEE